MKSPPASFYPRISSSDILSLGYERLPVSITYGNNKTITQEIITPNDYLIKDSENMWIFSRDGAHFRWGFRIPHPESMFGETGKVDPDSSVGLALIINSPKSSRTEVVKIAEITFDSPQKEFQVDFNLDGALYRDEITIRTAAYIGKKSQIGKINDCPSGTVLGDLDFITVHMKENDSRFPVVEKSNPDEPLWWVECKWFDISNDPFTEEYVALVLNKGHRNYKYLDKTNEKYFSYPLFTEVTASAIQSIIEKIKNSESEWNLIKTDRNPKSGTIEEVVQYIVELLESDDMSPEILSKNVRGYVERGLEK